MERHPRRPNKTVLSLVWRRRQMKGCPVKLNNVRRSPIHHLLLTGPPSSHSSWFRSRRKVALVIVESTLHNSSKPMSLLGIIWCNEAARTYISRRALSVVEHLSKRLFTAGNNIIKYNNSQPPPPAGLRWGPLKRQCAIDHSWGRTFALSIRPPVPRPSSSFLMLV